MGKILIKNGRVWDGHRFFMGDVFIRGDKIEKIAPSLDTEAEFVYDATGKTVTAGLVDCHVHMRGISREKFAIQGEMSAFPFGVTAAADAGGKEGDEALLSSFQLKSVVFVPVAVSDNRVLFSQAEKKLRDYGKRAVGIKLYFDGQSADVRDITPLRSTCAFAREIGLPVMVHASNQPVSMAALLEELSPGDLLTHCFHGGPNSAAADNFKSLKEAAERGVILDAAFAGHVHTDFKVLQSAFDCGVFPHTVSTDTTCRSAFTRGGRYGMTLCMTMARKAGMPEEELFRAVTSTPAKVLGKEKEWGFLAEGGKADLAVLEETGEGFALVDRAGNAFSSPTGYECALTLSDGQIVYRS